VPRVPESVPDLAEPVPRVPESVPDLAEPVPRFSESVPGLSKPVSVFSESVSGLSESMSGLTESLPDLAESLSGFAESLSGLSKSVSSLAEPMSYFAESVPGVNAEYILRSLIEFKLLDPRDAVRGGLSFTESSQRNLNLVVECSTRPGYFVKYPGSDDARSAIANEAAFYRRTERNGGLGKLGPFVPRFYLYDAVCGALVLELYSQRVTGPSLA